MTDHINPTHYRQSEVECIDALAAATAHLCGIEAVCTSNAIKYLWRWREKGGVQDLAKCQHYLAKLIEVLTEQQQEQA